jgi:hypothetical protein
MEKSVFVKYAKYWYHEIRLNVIPFDTANKRSVLLTYTEYQNKRIPLTVFNEWIEKGLFEKGMAIFPGKIYLDNNEEWYWVAIDLDSKKAIDEFCSIFGNDISLKELSEKFIVEQHKDNLDRAHLSLISPIPFPNKGVDSKIGLEIKSRGEHGIMFVAPSPHKNGFPYEIMRTYNPSRITLSNAFEMIEHIRNICKKYGLEYARGKRESKLKDTRIKQMIKHLSIKENSDYEIHTGSRNDTLFSIARSILYRHYGNNEQDAEKLKEFFEHINAKFCKPYALPQRRS